MNTPIRKRSSAAAALMAAVLGTALLFPTTSSAAANRWGASYFPNVEFTTQEGKTVRLWDDLLKDKKVIINFIYTECGASCPLETAKLAQVQRALGDHMGKDVFFYSFTIDPKRDTPAALKAYAKRFHAGKGWYFLTGSKTNLDLIRKKLGQAPGGDTSLASHKTSFMIGNVATGQWMPDSSLDDPNFIAMMAGDWLSSWQGHIKGRSYGSRPSEARITSGGAYLFKTRCSACHTMGGGDLVGPDLKNVAGVRDRGWLASFVTAPDKMLESDATAKALYKKYNRIKMPNFQFSATDVESIVKYLEEQAVTAKAASVPGAPSGPGTSTGGGSIR